MNRFAEILLRVGLVAIIGVQMWKIQRLRQQLKKPIEVHARTFGVIPNGQDCSDKLQIAISVISELGGSLVFEDGIYAFGGTTGQLSYRMMVPTNLLTVTRGADRVRLRDVSRDRLKQMEAVANNEDGAVLVFTDGVYKIKGVSAYINTGTNAIKAFTEP